MSDILKLIFAKKYDVFIMFYVLCHQFCIATCHMSVKLKSLLGTFVCASVSSWNVSQLAHPMSANNRCSWWGDDVTDAADDNDDANVEGTLCLKYFVLFAILGSGIDWTGSTNFCLFCALVQN